MSIRTATRQYRLSHWASLLQEKSTSGLTVLDFCKAKGITKNAYFYWQRILRETASSQLVAQSYSEPMPRATQFKEVKMVDPVGYCQDNVPGTLLIELGSCKLVADKNYPVELLSKLLVEITHQW
jgi:putative transposase